MSLEHLFDAELQYREGMAPVTADGEGELIGSGDGVARGEKLAGSFRWTLFEQPGELVCQMNPILEIATSDGAEVTVVGRGTRSATARATTDGRSRRRSASKATTSATPGSAAGSGSGPATSTPKHTRPATTPSSRPTRPILGPHERAARTRGDRSACARDRRDRTGALRPGASDPSHRQPACALPLDPLLLRSRRPTSGRRALRPGV